MIRMIATVYKNLHDLHTDLIGDVALDIVGYSQIISYNTDDLAQALHLFQESGEYNSFCERFIGINVYCYTCNSDGTVCRVELD